MIKVIATGSTGNSYLIEANENEKLLLECGIPYKQLLKGVDYNLQGIQGCLITHEHMDHCKSVNDMIHVGIDVYMSKGTRKAIKFKTDVKYRIHLVKKGELFKINNFTIIKFEVQHDVNEPLGYLIYHKDLGKILFATDTYYLKNRFMGVRNILIECNYSEDILDNLPPYRARVLRSHMSLETLKKTLKSWDLTGTKNITLIHLSGENGNPDKFQKEIEELTGIKTNIATPGLIISTDE